MASNTTPTRTLTFQGFTADSTAVTFVEHETVDDGTETGSVRGTAMVELNADHWRKLGAPAKVSITVAASDEA